MVLKRCKNGGNAGIWLLESAKSRTILKGWDLSACVPFVTDGMRWRLSLKISMPRPARCRLAFVLFALAVIAVAGEAAAQRIARTFAPGVLTVIPPTPQAEELFSGPQPLVELPVVMKDLKYEPKLSSASSTIFERSQRAMLRRTVWNLEFAFKPMRMINVDVPQAKPAACSGNWCGTWSIACETWVIISNHEE